MPSTVIYHRTFSLLSVVFSFFLVHAITAQNLVPTGDFQQGTAYWKAYNLSHKSFPVSDWSFTISNGKAIVTGTDCQPQARVGFRSNSIALPPKEGVYQLTVQWTGEKIHRAGVLTLLSRQGTPVKRENLAYSPISGDFQTQLKSYFAVQPEDVTAAPSLLIYIFHDGIGRLEIDEVIVEEIPAVKKPYVSDSRRKGPEISTEYDITNSLSDLSNPMGLTLRKTALSWSSGIVANLPYWTTETLTLHRPCQVQLPENQHAYLYYYGNYRYGKTDQDRAKDLKELRAIQSFGFTGVVFWDDYGLDFARWTAKKELRGDYFLTCCRMYEETGFRSPLVFSVFAGLERGKSVDPSTEDYQQYLNAVSKIVAQGQTIVGQEKEIVLQIVDEPNDTARLNQASQLARAWKQVIPNRVLTTVNWKSSQELSVFDDVWVGAGDYPSFEKLSRSKITGKYCSINPSGSPDNLRYLAGVHHWATGLETQAYWHFFSASGSVENDLDGSKPDYLCVSADGKVSAHLKALQLGLEDLSLLLKAEQHYQEKNNQSGLEYLSQLKDLVTTSNQPPNGQPNKFDIFNFRERINVNLPKQTIMGKVF